MKLLIDSGATKTDFFLKTQNHEIHKFQSEGINVNYVTDDFIQNQFVKFIKNLQNINYHDITEIKYYGAGCFNKINANRVFQILIHLFPDSKIDVYSDLLAVCHALLNNQPGFVGILGTGAASCYYNGSEIMDKAPSLGYILGDEGSGSHLGKSFITSYLKEEISKPLSAEFEAFFKLTHEMVIPKLYNENHPQHFLSSIPPFLFKHIENEEIHNLVLQSFNQYFVNQKQYFKKENISWNISGSIGFHFAAILHQSATLNNMTINKIIKSPLNELIDKL